MQMEMKSDKAVIKVEQ